MQGADRSVAGDWVAKATCTVLTELCSPAAHPMGKFKIRPTHLPESPRQGLAFIGFRDLAAQDGRGISLYKTIVSSCSLVLSADGIQGHNRNLNPKPYA